MLFFILYLLFFIFFIWLAWRKPIFASALVVILLPSYQIRFKIGFLPMTVLEMMILILFVARFFHQRIYKSIANIQIRKFELIRIFADKMLGDWSWLIIAWLLIATMAMFVSPNLQTAAGIWKAYFIEPILFLVVLVGQIKTKKDFNLILAGLFFSAFYISLWAIAQKIFGFGGVWSLEQWPATKIWRATGPFSYPNALGLYLAPITILIFGRLTTNYKNCLKFIVYCLLFILSLLAIILARSEGAILGIFAGLIFYLFLILKKKQKIILALFLFSIFYFLFFVSPWHQFLIQKITFQDFSGQLRLKIWHETWQMFKDRPIFGAGLAGYQTVMTTYHRIPWAEIYLYPHNIFLNFWSELGLAGLIIFVLILIKFFKMATNYKSFTNIRITNKSGFMVYSLASAMVILLIHGLVDVPYFKNDLAVLFWLIIGLSILVNKNFANAKDFPR